MKRLLPLLLIFALGACTPTYVSPPVTSEHPAGAEASQAPDTHAADILSTELVVETTWKRPAPGDPAQGPGMEHQHGDNEVTRENTSSPEQSTEHQHGEAADMQHRTASPMQASAVELPPEAIAHMRHLLDAYLAIGDQLSSDAVDEVPVNAQEMVAAMDALEKITVPGQPHFWHERASDLDMIRQQSAQLTTAGELHTARVALGKLSDALDRLIQTTGAPAGYEQPLYRFVCGMFQDAPQGGVWFQLGDQPRNPYFGSQMLTCHREKARVPASGKPSQMDPDGMDHNQMDRQNMDHQHQHEGGH